MEQQFGSRNKRKEVMSCHLHNDADQDIEELEGQALHKSKDDTGDRNNYYSRSRTRSPEVLMAEVIMVRQRRSLEKNH